MQMLQAAVPDDRSGLSEYPGRRLDGVEADHVLRQGARNASRLRRPLAAYASARTRISFAQDRASGSATPAPVSTSGSSSPR
jgi:hypothetical protein